MIAKEIKILEQGGIILYPTDTIWGLGCDATNPSAILKIDALKGRSEEKHLLVLVDGMEMLHNYVEQVPKKATELIKETAEPLTIIYSGAKNLPKELIGTEKTIGIRIPRFPWLQNLIKQFGKPIVSTSANFSGEPSPKTFSEISEQLKQAVDYVSSQGREILANKHASKIIKINKEGEITVLRK